MPPHEGFVACRMNSQMVPALLTAAKPLEPDDGKSTCAGGMKANAARIVFQRAVSRRTAAPAVINGLGRPHRGRSVGVDPKLGVVTGRQPGIIQWRAFLSGAMADMAYVLNFVYLLLLLARSPRVISSLLRKGAHRDSWAARLFSRVPPRSSQGKCFWLHVVQVGDVHGLAPLLMGLEQQHPDAECVISTTTKSALDAARLKYAPRTVFYCPLDFTWSVRRALRRIRPDVLVLTEARWCPNLLQAADQYGARVALIDGGVPEGELGAYRWWSRWMRARFQQLDLIAVPTDRHEQRFLGYGVPAERILVSGSIKFDGVPTEPDTPRIRELAALAGIEAGDVVFLAGSTREPEERWALEAFRQLAAEFPQLRLIIAPQHPDRFEAVAQLLDKSGEDWQRSSRLSRPGPPATARLLLVDAVGDARAWWGTAHIALAGGSFSHRVGQNLIEPAAFGAAVCFGPHTRDASDVVERMLECEAAYRMRHPRELADFVRRCLVDPQFATDMGRRARQLVQQQQGAADRTCARLSRLLD